MRQHLFKGMRIDNNEWIEGYLNYNEARKQYYIMDDVNAFPIPVYKDSIGEYTGMNEFVMSDRSYNKPLFEGDIVEVWGIRCPYWSNNPQSQYDGWMKIRAVIRFERGQWVLDYENKYNESLAKLKGKEEDDRTVNGSYELYWYGYHCTSYDEEWHREHNKHCKHDDIVKIGTEFENSELLEG